MNPYAATVYAFIVVCGLTCVVARITKSAAETRDRLDRQALAQQADDWSEPSRTDVEGPWLDETTEDWIDSRLHDDDAQWDHILRAVGVTPEDVAAAYRRKQLDERMERIHTDIACLQFRSAIDKWDGGAA